MNFITFPVNGNSGMEHEAHTPEKENGNFVSETAFQRMISLERKRTERSQKPFLLALLEPGVTGSSDKHRALLEKIVSGCMVFTRETDVKGWYRGKSVIGVMFTEIIFDKETSVVSTMLRRMSEILSQCLGPDQSRRVNISLHLFPENWHFDEENRPSNPTFYPDIEQRENSRRLFRFVKRGIDVMGSGIALVLCSPLMLAVAIAIKLTSPGPVFFRQQRVGQHGVEFTFFKFRSMFVNNDATLHKEWFKRFRDGKEERHSTANGDGSFKPPHDPRITPVGRWLRRTSLDELPQFLNVLKGDMSLVGPRPPIGYEVEAYEAWHRSRVLEAKPGITGLWQVNGRSRVTFDEMVRLDIRYARSCSLWLDVKILLSTPRAVLIGEGAY